MSNIVTRQPAFLLVLFAVGIGFCQPMHVFPLANFIEELLVTLGVLLAAAALLWRVSELQISVWVFMWLGLGAIGVASAWLHPAPFAAYKLLMAVFWFVALLSLLIGDQVDWDNEEGRWAEKLALTLFAIGIICSIGGFLRFYGLLGDLWRAYVPEPNTGRMTGLVGHSNFFAFISFFGILAAGWLVNRRRINVWFAGFAVLFLVAGIVASGNRGVLVAWVAVIMVLAVRRKEADAYRWLWFMGATFAFYWLLRPVYFLFDQWLYALVLKQGWVGGAGTDQSDVVMRGVVSSPRLSEWRVTLELIREHFLAGVGVGNYAISSYEQHLALGTPSPDGALFTHSHSSPMQVVVELGVLGLLWLLALFGLAIKAFRRASKQSERLLPLLVLLIIQIYSLIEFPLWIMHFLVLHMVLLGALGGRRITIKLRFGRFFSVAALSLTLILSVIYVPLIERMVWSFRQYFLRAPVQQQDYEFVNAMIRDPFLEPYGYVLYFANFDLSAETVPKEREVLERFRHFLPYPQIMVRLALVQMIEGDEVAARKTLSELDRYYGGSYKSVLYEQVMVTQARFSNVRFERLFVPAGEIGN